MSFKKGNQQGTPEVHTARSKLDGVLQTLVDRKEETSPQHSEEESLIHDILKDASPSSSPRKGFVKPSRKRRRKEDLLGSEMGQYHHTYVMKLFDRSVDLAQFEEETPLYPICRAWMRNQPLNRNLAPRKRSNSPEHINVTGTDSEEDEDKPRNIYKLPDSESIMPDDKGKYRDLRIPSPFPQPNEHLNIHADPESAAAPEQLLLNHMQRWKNIRQSWKEAGRTNESRYRNSLKILREMFDHQLKEN